MGFVGQNEAQHSMLHYRGTKPYCSNVSPANIFSFLGDIHLEQKKKTFLDTSLLSHFAPEFG